MDLFVRCLDQIYQLERLKRRDLKHTQADFRRVFFPVFEIKTVVFISNRTSTAEIRDTPARTAEEKIVTPARTAEEKIDTLTGSPAI